MKLQEFIDKNFAGNVSNFAKAYGVTRQTAYNLLRGATFPQLKLREALKRKGVRFEKKEARMQYEIRIKFSNGARTGQWTGEDIASPGDLATYPFDERDIATQEKKARQAFKDNPWAQIVVEPIEEN